MQMQVRQQGYNSMMHATTDHPSPPAAMRTAPPMSFIWDKFTASVDVLHHQGQRAMTDPASADPFKPSAGPAAPLSPEACFKIRTPDRLMVDLAEYRRGYCYSVDTTPESKLGAGEAQEPVTPRRVLEKDDSNDYSSFAGLKEGPSTAALFSPGAGAASSPFAAHTRQPFPDHASCRSNLSDYGYTTASDDDDSDFEVEANQQQCYAGAESSIPPPPEEGMGFWAEVGAYGAAAAGHCKPMDHGASAQQQQQQPVGPQGGEVCWAVNDDWESGSNASEQPDEDMGDAQVPEVQHGSASPCVLLPWDME